MTTARRLPGKPFSPSGDTREKRTPSSSISEPQRCLSKALGPLCRMFFPSFAVSLYATPSRVKAAPPMRLA